MPDGDSLRGEGTHVTRWVLRGEDREPGQVRKEAALSGFPRAPQTRLAGRRRPFLNVKR